MLWKADVGSARSEFDGWWNSDVPVPVKKAIETFVDSSRNDVAHERLRHDYAIMNSYDDW